MSEPITDEESEQIIQQLREKLQKAEAERDAVVEALEQAVYYAVGDHDFSFNMGSPSPNGDPMDIVWRTASVRDLLARIAEGRTVELPNKEEP